MKYKENSSPGVNEIAVIMIVYAMLIAALTIDPGHRRR
jgi:hypothetical protein